MYVVLHRLAALIFRGNGGLWMKAAVLLLTVTVILPVYDVYSLWALVVFYFLGISLLTDLVFRLFCVSGFWDTARRSGAVAAVLTLAVLGYAYFNMHRVTVTEYTVSTDKNIRSKGYDIVFLSDLHFGTTMEQEQLEKYCAEISARRPDAVILGGDIVDESTTLSQVRESFRTLGEIDSAYGVWYVYGNHDKGAYDSACDYTPEELAEAVSQAGIGILEDETVMLNGELSLTGRRDRLDARRNKITRKKTKTLLKKAAQDSYHILADHQPRKMEENEDAGCDLMLSGHTHAGQMWPVGLFTALFDKETFNYGQECCGDMDLIVSSGMGGWRYALRTGRYCEYVAIHIEKTEKI